MWRTAFIFEMLSSVVLLAVAAQAGDVHGRLVISRPLTKKKVAIPNYQMRGPTLARAPQETSEYQRLVVYVETASDTPTPISATLLQKNLRFEAEVVVIPVGSEVSFPNSDAVFHNVFSLSPARPFDLGYYPQGETRNVRFDHPGIVQVYCHLHADMSAAIVVVPNQWYAQPDAHGAFSLSSIPAGTHQLVVWHKSAGFFRRRVVVPAEGSTSISIDIPLQEAPEP